MLDINIFRDDKGGNPELVCESQRRRFASIDVVNEIIQLDKAWRQRQFELEGLRKEFNRINKEVARLKIAREDATEMIKSTEENKRQAAEKELEVQAAKPELDAKLGAMGNLVHDSIPVSTDEANNEVVRTWGDRRMEEKLKNHVDLVNLLGIADLEKGLEIGGELNMTSGIQVAQLALKHRQNKNQQQRIIIFAGRNISLEGCWSIWI